MPQSSEAHISRIVVCEEFQGEDGDVSRAFGDLFGGEQSKHVSRVASHGTRLSLQPVLIIYRVVKRSLKPRLD